MPQFFMTMGSFCICYCYIFWVSVSFWIDNAFVERNNNAIIIINGNSNLRVKDYKYKKEFGNTAFPQI